ncbi:MAG: dihydrodipicolinate synthase family protein [Bryobacterales bacterium]
MNVPRPFRGVVPPLATPLLDRDTLDVTALERLLASLIDGGIHGVFALGTTGEATSLSQRVRHEIVDRVCGQCDGLFPVLVGVSDTSVEESLRMAEYAASRGAVGVVMTAPYYFPLTQSEMLSFLERVSGEFPLPLFLYDLPSHVRFRFEPETVRQAAEFPNVWGIKDSTGDLDQYLQLRDALASKPEFTILVGPEQLLGEAVSHGAHGGVCGGANLYPELYVGLYDAARAGNQAEVARLHEMVMKICDQIYTVGEKGSSYLRGLKCALAWKGIGSGFMAEPYSMFGNEDSERIRECLVDIGILPQPVHGR